MTKSRIIPKGTKVKFKGCCNLAGSDTELEERVLSEDTSLEELNEEAFESSQDYFQVEGWVEVQS